MRCGAKRNRTVEGGARRFVFVTGAPVKVVARHEAAGNGNGRSITVNAGDAGKAPCRLPTARARHGREA